MNFRKKSVSILFFAACALLAGCSRSPAWDLDALDGSDSAQLIHRTRNFGTGIEVQFFRSEDNIQGFLIVHGRPVPADKNNPKFILVHIDTSDGNRQFSLYRRTGGQVLVLPDEASQFLIEALLNKTEIELSFYHYKETISPKNFSKLYNNFLNPFPISNPFQIGV